MISTDKNPAYNEAIASLQREGRLAATCQHRQVKYLNNRLEPDHGKLKQRIRTIWAFLVKGGTYLALMVMAAAA